MSSHFLASEGGWASRRVTEFWLSALGRGTQLKEWCITAGDGAWKVERDSISWADERWIICQREHLGYIINHTHHPSIIHLT